VEKSAACGVWPSSGLVCGIRCDHSATLKIEQAANKKQEMTMPDERARALIRARELLVELTQVRGTLDPQVLRERAEDVLRHYPDDGMIVLITRGTAWLDMPERM
jgi:hypothetical protein